MRRFGDMQIHCVMSFDKRINAERLAKAIILSLDLYPVLSCRMVHGGWRPYWKNRTDLSDMVLFDVVELSANRALTESLIRFVTEPSDPFHDPVVKARIFRTDADTLCIKLNHVVTDASGVKGYAYTIAELYRTLHHRPDLRYNPNAAPAERSFRLISRQFGLIGKMQMFRRGLRDLRDTTFPRAYWSFPARSMEVGTKTFVVRRIEQPQFSAIRDYSRNKDATVNDVMLASYYRALVKIVAPASGTPLRLRISADLRRYLSENTRPILSNLSGIVYPNIGMACGDSFDDTLLKVTTEMNSKKNDFLGLGDWALLTIPFKLLPFRLARWQYDRTVDKMLRSGNTPPGFANMGVIEHEKLVFQDVNVVDAFLLGPATYPPFFLVGMSTFADSATLSAGFCEGSVPRPLVEQLLDQMIRELPGFQTEDRDNGLCGSLQPAL
jgi:NRPS condensation-like uncharacterized protein